MNSPLPHSDRSSASATLDVLDVMWRRKAAVALMVMVAVALGAAVYALTPPTYESRADVLLVAKRPQALTGNQQYESGFEGFLATHRALIVSPLIVKRAVEQAKLASLESFAEFDSEDDRAAAIIADLEAGAGPRSLGDSADSIMTLTYSGSNPDECPVVVAAIVASYQSFLDETYRGLSEDVMRLIGQARDLLQNDLRKQQDDYTGFRKQSPLVTRGKDEVNPLQDRLAAIEAQRSELLLRHSRLQAQFTAFANAKRAGHSGSDLVELISDLRSRANQDDGFSSVAALADSQLVELTNRERQLLEQFGENHPHVQSVRRRIKAIQKLYILPTAAHLPESGEGRDWSDEEAVAFFEQHLRRELEVVGTAEKLLSELFERERGRAKELAGFQLEDERRQRDIERTQQLYDEVIHQLQEASLAKDVGGFETRVIAAPQVGERTGPRLSVIGGGSLLLGLCFGGALALLLEWNAPTFRSNGEIERQLACPVLARIPAAPRFVAPADANRTVPAHSEPQVATGEAIRALRTALMSRTNQRMVQVAGLGRRNDARMLTVNLAGSLAHLEQRVLVLDAELPGGTLHELLGGARQPGVAAVLNGRERLDAAIQGTPVPNLWLLPAGAATADDAELTALPRFREMLDQLQADFDWVLVHTGPLLAGADPGVIAVQVGSVLLSMKRSGNPRADILRTRAFLETLGVRVLGVVVNDLD